MEKPTLLVLAAGMGSRFGGLKQVMGFGPGGEALIDYALYDARLAGFERAVFVVRPGIAEEIERRVRRSVNRDMEIDFALQDLRDLPAGFECPAGREKPWGTGHAVFAARGKLGGAFGVIGSDDFFGRDAFEKLYALLKNASAEQLGQVAYRLDNTLSENGAVSRGVCEVEDGFLKSVTERTSIIHDGENIFYEMNGNRFPLDPKTPVSLNVWALHAGVFAEMERDFAEFLSGAGGDNVKREYYLPAFIDRLVASGKARVRVDSAHSRWYGVTHASDAQTLREALARMHDAGEYPSLLP